MALFPYPGLTHTPRSEKFELAFSMNDVETYLKYTKNMQDLLKSYDEEKQRDQMKFEDCGGKTLAISSIWIMFVHDFWDRAAAYTSMMQSWRTFISSVRSLKTIT